MKNKIQLVVLILLSISILFVIPLLPSVSEENSTIEAPSLQTLVISEVVTKNVNITYDEDGDYSDYIEIYNTGDEPISLKGYGLSDEPSVPLKWTFPETEIAPHTYLVIYASGKNKALENLHTNFKLNENGDRLALSDPKGNIIQILPLADCIDNMSYALNDKGQYVFYTTGTPGSENDGLIIDDLKAYKRNYIITFSKDAGFYKENIEVSLSVPHKGVSIRYTLDGTDPTSASPTYETPISVQSKTLDPLLYANLPSTFGSTYKPSFTEVFKGTVLKAQSFQEEIPMGDIVTNTYFITEMGSERYSLPVVSLTTDPYNFYDDEKGIYVVGSKFQALAPSKPDGSVAANYNQRGREWERPIHLEYFNLDGQCVFEQNLGIRTMGGWSRANPKKSFKLFSRESYQEDAVTMDYPFFENLETVDGTPIESFSRLSLRSGGNDWDIALFRDPFMQDLVADTLDTQAAKPVILFINGEYWGIYFLNEIQDEYYIQSHYDIAKKDINIMSYSTALEVYVGTDEDMTYYQNMVNFIEENDLSIQENYDYINTLVDLDNFIDYYVAQIYFCNTDWPANNVKFWRKRTEAFEPTAPYGQDGRYRYLLYDTDFGFSLYNHNSNPAHKTIDFAAAENGPEWPNPEWSTLLFRSLLKNEFFKQKFINTLADDLNTRFEHKTVDAQIDYYKDLLKPEIEEYSKRYQMWAMPDLATWEEKTLEVLRDFAKKRPNHLRINAVSYFNLKGAFDLTLSVNDPHSGVVRINDHINLFEAEPSTKFTGMYFTNIPITIEALPQKGYRFVGWTGTIESSDPRIEASFTSDLQLVANFAKE